MTDNFTALQAVLAQVQGDLSGLDAAITKLEADVTVALQKVASDPYAAQNQATIDAITAGFQAVHTGLSSAASGLTTFDASLTPAATPAAVAPATPAPAPVSEPTPAPAAPAPAAA